jgi:DNA-binding winged helix-turn-helix (wHTH) protein
MNGDFYLGAWLVQPSLGRVSLDGRTVQVRPKVMDLLVYLAGSPGKLISKETLLNDVWRSEAISESALTRTITELRSAVADDVNEPQFLETIPKRGYRLIATVRPVEPVEDRPPVGRRTPAVAMGIGALLIAGSIFVIVEMNPREPTEPPRVTPLTSSPGQEGQPSFSPDGTRVAFVWSGEADDNFDIYVKRIGDVAPVRLTTDPGRDQSPAWSADGRAIAFVRPTAEGVGVYVVPAAGSGERFLGNLRRTRAPTTWMAPRTRILDWFPDGRALVVSDQRSPADPFQIFRLDIDTGERQPLTSPPPQWYGDAQPAVSPDGRMVAFTRSLSIGSFDIHVVSATGGEPRRLTFDNSVITGLAWTVDSARIVFSSERAATAGAGSLWTVPASGSPPGEKLQAVPGVGPRAHCAGDRRTRRAARLSGILSGHQSLAGSREWPCSARTGERIHSRGDPGRVLARWQPDRVRVEPVGQLGDLGGSC